jgi:hypothetical protein
MENRIQLTTDVCRIWQEIIHTRFSSLREITSVRISNSQEQEKENSAAPQKPEGRPKMTHAKATRNSIETPTITAETTQKHALI